MLVCFEKKNWTKNLKKFQKFYWQFWKFFKHNLEGLENFNKMYTIIYAFHCFFKEKHCTLIVYITEFFLKSGGPNALLAPPPSKIWGGHGSLAPPPLWRTPCNMVYSTIKISNYTYASMQVSWLHVWITSAINIHLVLGYHTVLLLHLYSWLMG